MTSPEHVGSVIHQYIDPKNYIGPNDPGYDRQVLRISRQITFTSVIPISSYNGATVPDAVAYEHELELSDVMEILQFIDESVPGQSVEMRTHVDVGLTAQPQPAQESTAVEEK